MDSQLKNIEPGLYLYQKNNNVFCAYNYELDGIDNINILVKVDEENLNECMEVLESTIYLSQPDIFMVQKINISSWENLYTYIQIVLQETEQEICRKLINNYCHIDRNSNNIVSSLKFGLLLASKIQYTQFLTDKGYTHPDTKTYCTQTEFLGKEMYRNTTIVDTINISLFKKNYNINYSDELEDNYHDLKKIYRRSYRQKISKEELENIKNDTERAYNKYFNYEYVPDCVVKFPFSSSSECVIIPGTSKNLKIRSGTFCNGKYFGAITQPKLTNFVEIRCICVMGKILLYMILNDNNAIFYLPTELPDEEAFYNVEIKDIVNICSNVYRDINEEFELQELFMRIDLIIHDGNIYVNEIEPFASGRWLLCTERVCIFKSELEKFTEKYDKFTVLNNLSYALCNLLHLVKNNHIEPSFELFMEICENVNVNCGIYINTSEIISNAMEEYGKGMGKGKE